MRNVVSRILRLSPGLACVLYRHCGPCCPNADAAVRANPGHPGRRPDVALQQAGIRQQSGTTAVTIPVSVNEVYLVFAVTDKKGHFIRDLKQSDFALLDDHKAPAQVYSFSQQTNLPLRVGVLIDTSTSIRQRFQFEQQAASAFLLQIVRPRSDKAFIEGFDVMPDYRQDWTNKWMR